MRVPGSTTATNVVVVLVSFYFYAVVAAFNAEIKMHIYTDQQAIIT